MGRKVFSMCEDETKPYGNKFGDNKTVQVATSTWIDVVCVGMGIILLFDGQLSSYMEY